MNVLCFDIETIPDIEFGRRIFNLGDLDDESVAKVMRFKQLQARQTDFLPLPQHRVVVISAVLRNSDGLHVFSLGEQLGSEREIVQAGFEDAVSGRDPKVDTVRYGRRLEDLFDSPLEHGELDDEAWDRLITWIDLNCPLWPDYTFRLNRPQTKTAQVR